MTFYPLLTLKHQKVKLLMNFFSHPIILLVFFCCVTSLLHGQQTPSLKKIDWQHEKISQGLVLKYAHTNHLFDSKQYINVLKVSKKRQLSLAYETSILKPTSQFGQEKNALAAINAGFFDMKIGGSVTFMKVNDEVINRNITSANNLTQSCIAIDENKRLHIFLDSTTLFFERPENYDDVLYTGPLLIENRKKMPLEDKPFNSNRHPRTCACTLNNGKILLITVDGRNAQAQGMSLFELSDLLQQLKCVNAINLDGGGSTTLWLKSKGIINHPSDNQTFDAAGERKVANVILVH
jgi:exopolysaccharide biosynthesis protein